LPGTAAVSSTTMIIAEMAVAGLAGA